MPIKIAVIGAGSIGFTRGMMRDILCVPELQDAQISFTDINKRNLDMVTQLMDRDLKANKVPAKLTATTDRKRALEGADYVFNFTRIGGLDAFKLDVDIPLKYGIDQCVADTLCAGGIMYGQRNIPQILAFCDDMREVSSENVLFLNYANPNAMNTWAANEYGNINTVGLCHGVMGGHWQITEVIKLLVNGKKKPADKGYVNITPKDVDIICAGINHQTWYIQVTHKGKDMLPFLLEAMEKHPEISKSEPCRIDVLRRFGYFCTESNGHLSEYLPWYRKNPEEMKKWIYTGTWIGGPTGGYLGACRESRDEYVKMYPKWLSGEAEYIKLGERTSEHASYIIEGLETGRRYRGHFNVENRGLITNLPERCTVEIPCYVDGNGISPAWVGPLPMACAATCRASVSVQEMTVEAALTGDRELVKLAVLHDPLTGAVCNTEQVWQMCDEMFEALAPWLPQFNGEGRRWNDIPQPNNGVLRFPKAADGWRPPALER